MKPIAVAAAAALSALLIPAAGALAISETIVLDRANRGEVEFTHRRHALTHEVACDECHHNIDPIGSGDTTCRGCHTERQHDGLCHECHLSTRDDDYDVRSKALEERLGRRNIPNLFKSFHELCRTCHARLNEKQGKRAPYECGGCHR